jgi:dihydrodipicolinate synthase/N-acetylneuraminate lyase
LDYARFAEKAGVDGLQIAMSQYGDDESHFKHYKELVASTRLGIVVHGKPGLALWRKLVTLDSIVAFKEEFDPYYTLPLYKEFGERINIYAGGQKSRLLTYRPYGMNAYYSTFSSFAPEIAMRFWKTVEGKREREAGDIILAYDVPFFQRWSHSFWRATLEVFGIASRFLRPPEETFSDEQVSDARSFYQKLGLIPG